MTDAVEIVATADAEPERTCTVVEIEGDQSDDRRDSVPDEEAGAILPPTVESCIAHGDTAGSGNC